MADRLRQVRAVDAIDRLAEIERPGAERIAGTAGHEARQIGLALDHLRRRTPIGPFLLARDLLQAAPLETVAADADAVAHGAAVRHDEIEIALRREHDAWRWARETALCWPEAAQVVMVDSLRSYTQLAELKDIEDVRLIDELCSAMEYRRERQRRLRQEIEAESRRRGTWRA